MGGRVRAEGGGGWGRTGVTMGRGRGQHWMDGWGGGFFLWVCYEEGVIS